VNIRFSVLSFFVGFFLLVPGLIWNEVGDGYQSSQLLLNQGSGNRDSEFFSRKLIKAFGTEPVVAREFSDWVLEASMRHRLEPDLIASLISVESSFQKSVESHRGAIGPTQVKPKFWQEFCGNNDLYDPEQNVYCGAMILSYLMDRCKGNYSCALSAYNVGFYGDRWQAGKRYIAKIDRNVVKLQSLTL